MHGGSNKQLFPWIQEFSSSGGNPHRLMPLFLETQVLPIPQYLFNPEMSENSAVCPELRKRSPCFLFADTVSRSTFFFLLYPSYIFKTFLLLPKTRQFCSKLWLPGSRQFIRQMATLKGLDQPDHSLGSWHFL